MDEHLSCHWADMLKDVLFIPLDMQSNKKPVWV